MYFLNFIFCTDERVGYDHGCGAGVSDQTKHNWKTTLWSGILSSETVP